MSVSRMHTESKHAVRLEDSSLSFRDVNQMAIGKPSKEKKRKRGLPLRESNRFTRLQQALSIAIESIYPRDLAIVNIPISFKILISV